MGFILCWFRIHWSILHSWFDIRVHLILWQCSWGLSVVLSRKSRLLTCLIGNTILLCTKCREIWPSFESGLSRYIPLETKGQSPSHLPIAEGKLRLRCLWKTGSPLQSKTGNQLSSWDDMWCMQLSSCCCAEMNIHIDLRRGSQRISVVSSRKSSHLYCILWNTW